MISQAMEVDSATNPTDSSDNPAVAVKSEYTTKPSENIAVTSNTDGDIPTILRGEDILVPVKIDITAVGARYVDTFCWNISSTMKYTEFAGRICSDKNLSLQFQTKIALQLAEQVQAFKILISTLKQCFSAKAMPNIEKLKKSVLIQVGVRLNTLDYSDKFTWDPMDPFVTPEIFASSTCNDLGLPSEIGPAIAHKVRELLFRNMILWLDDPIKYDPTEIVSNQSHAVSSDIKVTLIPQLQAVDMASNLWKRAKPQSIEEQSLIPQPLLPENKDTNASLWA